MITTLVITCNNAIVLRTLFFGTVSYEIELMSTTCTGPNHTAQDPDTSSLDSQYNISI